MVQTLPPLPELSIERCQSPIRVAALAFDLCVLCTIAAHVSYSSLSSKKSNSIGNLSIFCLGIDCNDMRKSMITFQFISTFAALIPFVDFSSASEYHQLTEEEQQIRSALFWFPFP
jgi:proteasome activator subunit 4